MKTTPWQKISNRWQSIANNSINRKIFSAAIVVAGGTTFVKAIAMVKELVVAWKFGTADELDAFLIALTIPAFIIAVVAGSLNSALIPTYIKVREQEGKQAAQKLFSGATVGTFGLLLVTTVVVIAASPFYLPYITSGFPPAKLALTYQLLWTISPMILLSGIGVVWGAILNAGERFALVALVPTITSVVTMLFLILVPAWGVFNLAIGMIVGQLLEMLIIGATLKRQGVSLLPQWHGFDERLKEVAGQYAPAFAGAFLMCSSSLVDQSMAAMLPSGSVAALSYGNRIISLPIIIASTALSTAVIPYFSKMVALDDWANIRQALKHYLVLILIATIPLTGLIFFCSEPIVYLLLQRGSFTASNTQLVAQIQAYFALQIPFYIAGMLLVRLISAMRINQVLMWGSAGNLIINIALNYAFMQWLGVVGIALSTSCVYLFSFSFLLFFVLRNLKGADNLDLTSQQTAAIARLRSSKFDQIDRVLTPEQRQIVRQLDLHRQTQQQRHGIGLSADQKTEISAIRQENLQILISLLTPDRISQLKQINGWEKGISIFFVDMAVPLLARMDGDSATPEPIAVENRGLGNKRMERLNLTLEQQAEISQLWLIECDRINAILTTEQQQQAASMQRRRNAVRVGWKNLNLTVEQKAKIKAIRHSHKQQLNEILNPEQQLKIKYGNGRYKIQ
jgi:putative peptidoglycan lipid II flippase